MVAPRSFPEQARLAQFQIWVMLAGVQSAEDTPLSIAFGSEGPAVSRTSLQALMSPTTTKQSRPRWSGSLTELLNVMSPHIPTPRSIVMYAEKTNTKINKAQLHAQADLLSALYAFYSPMTFNRSTLQAALLQHSSTSGWLTTHWHNQPKQQALWAKVSGLRLKAMCRHATQSLFKQRGKHATWVQSVLQGSFGATRARSGKDRAAIQDLLACSLLDSKVSINCSILRSVFGKTRFVPVKRESCGRFRVRLCSFTTNALLLAQS